MHGGGYNCKRIVNQGRWAERPQLQIHLTGFDLGKVEDVVDDRHQRCARVVHQVDISALFWRQLCRPRQQIYDAFDASQRRADLVAHRSEEVRLGAVRILGLDAQPVRVFACVAQSLVRAAQCVVGAAQCILSLLAACYVASDLRRPDDLAACVAKRRYSQRDRDAMPVFGETDRLVMFDTLASRQFGEYLRLFHLKISGDNARDGRAHHLSRRVTENSSRRWVPVVDRPFQGLADNSVVRSFDDRSKSLSLQRIPACLAQDARCSPRRRGMRSFRWASAPYR